MTLPNLSSSIGSMVPIFGGATEDAPPIPLVDHQTARIIVGNAVAGDTIAVCNILDPGDGTGIIAAMTAATAAGIPVDIFIRAGTYTLAAGAPLITVPTNAREIKGAGQGVTNIVGTAVSGVSPQILVCADGTMFRGISLVSPENVAGQLAASPAGIVAVGVGCKFYNVNLTLNISSSVASLTSTGFRYSAAASPEDVEFHDCNVTFANDNAIGIPTAGNGFVIRASTSVPSTKPVRYVNCSVLAVTGAAGSGVFGITAYGSGPHVEIVECDSIRCTTGAATSPGGASFTANSQGPLILGLRCSFTGFPIAKQAFGVQMTIGAGTAIMRHTCIQAVRCTFDANSNTDSRAVFLRAGGTSTMQNVLIEAQQVHPTAGSGGLELYCADSSVWTDVSVRAQLGTGDVTVVNGLGSMSNLKLSDTVARTLTLVSCVTGAMIGDTCKFTTITNGGVGTIRSIVNTVITPVTVSGSVVLPANYVVGSLCPWGMVSSGGGGGGGVGGIGQTLAAGVGGGGGGGGRGGGGVSLFQVPGVLSGVVPGDTLTVVIPAAGIAGAAGSLGVAALAGGNGGLASLYKGATELVTWNRPLSGSDFGGHGGGGGVAGTNGASGGAGGVAGTSGGSPYQVGAAGGSGSGSGGNGGAGGAASSPGVAGTTADPLGQGRGNAVGLAARAPVFGSGGALGAAGGTAGGGGGGGGGGQGGQGHEVATFNLALPIATGAGSGSGGTGGGAGGAGVQAGTGVAGGTGGSGLSGSLGRGGGGGQGGGGGGAGAVAGGAGGSGGAGAAGSNGLVVLVYQTWGGYA